MRITDAISQYPAFFEGVKDGDLFTFKIGLGTNFYTIWTTYLASPLSFLYFFFENYQFDLFFLILVLLKIGLIGLNMNILLNYKRKRNKCSIVFSTIYALSGFVSLYYFNYQFLDAIYMLPLIMIGIDKLVNDNKNLMYFITLTLMIMFHYYTAYMICIFSVIYFFFLLVNTELEKKEKKKRVIKFFVTSLFCGLCSSFITIPSIYSLMQGRNSYFNDLNYFSFNKDSLSLFYNFTSGNNFVNDLTNTSTPVFITLFILVLVIYSLFSKNYSKKYRISILIVLLIFILSISFNLFYYGWHFFQIPNGVPGRFVFAFNCFFVLISYKTFINDNYVISNVKKVILIIIIIILIVISFCLKLNNARWSIKYVDYNYFVSLICSFCVLVYYIFFVGKKKFLSVTFALIFLELIINLIFSFNINLFFGRYEYYYVKENSYNIKMKNSVLSKTSNSYRIETEDYNGGLLYGYNGVNIYSSLFNQNLNEFLNNFQIDDETNNHLILYNPNTFFNSLLGLKYYILENSVFEYNVVENIGFLVSKDNRKKLTAELNDENIINYYNYFTDFKFNLKLERMDYEEKLINLNKIDNKYVRKNENDNSKIIRTFNVKEDCYVNFSFPKYNEFRDINNNFQIPIKDITKLYLNDIEVQGVYKLKKGDVIRLEIEVPKELDLIFDVFSKITYINMKQYDKMINYLNDNTIKDVKYNSTGFIAKVEVEKEKKLLLLTIPYDENITIKLDDDLVEFEKYLNGIIGIEISEGTHLLTFNYSIKGLKMGILISLSFFIVFVCLKILEKIIIYRYNKNDNKEESLNERS